MVPERERRLREEVSRTKVILTGSQIWFSLARVRICPQNIFGKLLTGGTPAVLGDRTGDPDPVYTSRYYYALLAGALINLNFGKWIGTAQN